MRKDIETYELIEKFISNELQGEEQEGFLKKISEDPHFAHEVKKHQEMFDLIMDYSMLDIKKKIQDIHHDSIHNSGNSWFKRNIRNLIIGGTVMVSVPVILLLMNKNDEPANNEINNKIITNQQVKSENNIKADTEIKTKKEEIASVYSSGEDINTVPDEEQENNSTKEVISGKSNTVVQETSGNVISHDFIDENTIIKEAKPSPDYIAVQEDEKKTNCDKVTISAIVNTELSCDNKPTGKIIINEQLIEGGTYPYEVSIDNGITYNSKFLFEKLSSGSYTIFVKDLNNCISEIGSYWIKSKECGYNDAFRPSRGETWKIPNNNSTGNLRIYNTGGQLVYEKLLDFQGEYIWDGTTNTGNILPMGVYSFILELEEAENIKGTITIIR